MKNKVLLILITIFSVFNARAQQTINVGDFAVVGFNTTNDAVSWVTFVDLCPCTEFYFSDNPYKNATGYCTSQEEFCIHMVVNTFVPAGTIITYTDASYPTVGTISFLPNVGSITPAYAYTNTAGTNNGFNANGDNVAFFQGTYAAPNFICALKNSGNWNAAGTVACSNRNDTELPGTLTNGVNALYTNQCMGTHYNCTLTTGTAAALSAAINNSANWTCDASNPVTLPPACGFTVTNPGPCVSCGVTDTVCQGQPANLVAQGSSGTFKWYDAVTGGNLLYTGNPYTPALNTYTTYYVTNTVSGQESSPRIPVTVSVTPKPNAGPDKTAACVALPGGSVNMGATGTGTWYAQAGNPGNASIANAGSATTAISAFSAAGTYNFIWASNGCTDTAAVTVTQAANASIATPGVVTCTHTNVTLTASSTTTGATYNWGGGIITAGNTVSGAGNYVVTVTAPGGCTATASASVAADTSSPDLTVGGPVNLPCIGNDTIPAASSVTGATYQWSGPGIVSGGSAAQVIINSPGLYTVTVTNPANGCTASGQATANAGAQLTLSGSSNPATCGNTNGSASVTVTGGTGPYTYHWNTLANTQGINNIGGGNYTVSVTGAGGCSATATVNVATTGGLSVTTNAVATTCGNNNGSATAQISTGTGPFTYLWSNSDTSATINNLQAANYEVTVTGSSGCTGTASASVASSTGVNVTITPASTTCGNNNGAATATATGGSNYNYIWSNNGTTATINNLPSGNYTVTVTSGTCSATAGTTINASGANNVSITSDKSIMCSGDSATICAPSGFTTYAWSTGDTGRCLVTSDAGNYYVTVTDNGNCTATSNHINLAIYTPTPVTISVNGDTLTGYSAVSYQWYFNGAPLANDTGKTIIAHQSGIYTLTIQDVHGCYYTSSPVNVNVSGMADLNIESISVFPNPSRSGIWQLLVDHNLLGATLQIFDATGRLALKYELQQEQSTISLPNSANGIYQLHIISGNACITRRLVKL